MITETISHYRIIKPLGAGGMGEVYLAEDTQLERTVALKVLPADVVDDKQRMRRFTQEAKTASALNHPNILTIFEIGHAEATHFIATEFIDGDTLRQRMQGTRMKLSDVLNVASQAADALSAAHEAGIIHRDIKPENIMLRRRDAYVKVLDFGLAKLMEQQPATVDTEAATKTLFQTDAGVVLGTALYMSPEQARGLQVDARTDIWSLGVVLYEMVAGCLPFEGSTTSEILAAIINEKEPPPLARFAREVPAELERMVEKALRKDREERYQTAKDMLLDLKRLKQRLEVDAAIERSVAPEVFGVTPSGGRVTDAKSSPPEGGTPSARPTSSAEYVINGMTRHKLAVLLALLVVVSASIGLGLYFNRRNTEPAIESIAVLPFANASADPNTEYLSDGVTNSLIYSLSRLPNLKVKSHSSVFRYKGKEVDPQTPGRELGVQAVLTGRIVQRGEMLVINAELVEVGSNNVLWGQQYNRKLSEIQSVQDEISKGVSEKLRLKLTGEEQQRLTRHYTALPEAYQAYLRGKYYSNHAEEGSERKAINYFNQAISLDPNYAQPYAGLAAVYADISSIFLPPSEAMPKAKEAVLKALALDESLAEAHFSLALIHWWADWDFPAAEREFKRAIELSPNEPTVHVGYGGFLSRMPGRFDEAIAAANRGLQLDSFSVTANIGAVIVFYNTRHYDRAIEQALKTLERDPHLALPRYFLGAAYLEKRQYEQAITELEKHRNRPVALGLLSYTYAVAGRKAEALKALAELQAISGRRYVSPYEIARVYVGLREKEQAFEWLEKAYQGRSDLLTRLQVDPTFDSLRSDPRFADLVRRVGLEKQ